MCLGCCHVSTLPKGQILPSLWPIALMHVRHGVEITSAELFCRILSVSLHHPLDHSRGNAWLEKWALLVLRICSLNSELTPFRLGSQRSRALVLKRSTRARQSPDQDAGQRHEPPARACSPRTAALWGQHLTLLFFRKTAQHGAGLLWGVFHQQALDRWRDLGCSCPWSAGRGANPQATPSTVVCAGQRRLLFLSPSPAFDGALNPSLS